MTPTLPKQPRVSTDSSKRSSHDLRFRSPLLRLEQVDTEGSARVVFAGGERVFGDAHVWATIGPEETP